MSALLLYLWEKCRELIVGGERGCGADTSWSGVMGGERKDREINPIKRTAAGCGSGESRINLHPAPPLRERWAGIWSQICEHWCCCCYSIFFNCFISIRSDFFILCGIHIQTSSSVIFDILLRHMLTHVAKLQEEMGLFEIPSLFNNDLLSKDCLFLFSALH